MGVLVVNIQTNAPICVKSVDLLSVMFFFLKYKFINLITNTLRAI